MGRHKIPPARGAHALPTGARLIASVAAAAAGAGALAAALVPAGGHAAVHATAPRTAHVAAAHPVPAAPAPAARDGKSGGGQQPAGGGSAGAAKARHSTPGAGAGVTARMPSAASARRLDALRRERDSTSPEAVLSLVNQARAQAGSPPLKLSPTLTADADRITAGLPEQAGPAGVVTGVAAGASAGQAVGISRNEVGAQAAANDWFADPAQRAKLLDPHYTALGVSTVTTPEVIWWTQVLGR
ncbi:CAP domain-containing protein [Streptomyces bambusae]|uniref:CAP domain-containing protein n=1 Tax=Streptomyces bambusae TaxID=1550616 RepID=UPI001CFD9C0A|nr:CAP domain-containing protein [Streptomyces bambusae]MCB5164616.1 CAP domain-containing protein [Streptomyces bambusae]